MSNALWPHGLWSTRLLYPWDPPGKHTGVGCHFLLTQQSSPGLPHCRQILCHLSHQGSPLFVIVANIHCFHMIGIILLHRSILLVSWLRLKGQLHVIFGFVFLLEETWRKPSTCSTKLLTWPNQKWRWLIYTHFVTLPMPRRRSQRNMD